MSSEIHQFLMQIAFTSIFFLLIWFATRFRKPKSLGIKFATPRKEAALAIGYVIGFSLSFAVVLFFLAQRAGGPLGVPIQFDFLRALRQCVAYAVMFIIPVFVIIRVRKQSFETVGVTKKNVWLSVGIGLALSTLLIALSTTPERFLNRFFSSNAFYAFMYYLAVGFGEELIFRGLLQLRCSTWLGEIQGWILASTIMALIHIPQRIFAVGLNLLQATMSALSLMPFSLLLGFLMLRTQNVLGSTALHTVANWVSVL